MKRTSWWIATLFLPAFAVHAQANVDCASVKVANPGNATYTIEGDTITLVNGTRSQPAASGSHTMHETRLIDGTQTCGEFGGQPVVVVLLSDDPGGSGTYVYMAVVPKSGRSFPAVLLGDRIQPKSVAIENNLIVVTYLDRATNAPMGAIPSVKVVRRFGLQHDHLMDQP